MESISKKQEKFQKLTVSTHFAMDLFKNNKYKNYFIGKIPSTDKVTLYRCGNFIDFCRGPHILNTGIVKIFFFFLRHSKLFLEPIYLLIDFIYLFYKNLGSRTSFNKYFRSLLVRKSTK